MVYALNRLSEDLDLDNNTGLDLSNLAPDLQGFFRNTFGSPEASVKSQRGERGILRVTLKIPVLRALGLSLNPNEALHLKVEVSHHEQVADIRHTPVFCYGRSFVPSHFSLETMMAGKMLACLERNFQRGKEGIFIKGRDFYDLLWFMQKRVHPLQEKLAKDGVKAYTVRSAMLALKKKVDAIKPGALAVDLLPLFESRIYVEEWLKAFHTNFIECIGYYLR